MTERNHDKDEIEEDDPNAVYIQPNIEHELSKEKRDECRNIVQEIKNFGVSQRQLLFLIQLMAMELENREVMTSVVGAIGQVRQKVPAGNKLVLTGKLK